MVKKVKWNGIAEKTFAGKLMQPDEEYVIQKMEESNWSSDADAIAEIAQGNLWIYGDDVHYVGSDGVRLLMGGLPSEVTTQMEKNDKTLRTVYLIGTTDANGVVRVCMKVPSNGRKIAYGDAEFETRHMGDVVRKIEFSDLERRIAWMLALAQDPNATEPLADAVVQQIQIPDVGHFPLYPVLDHYDERSLPTGENAPYNEGTIGGGVAMTYQFGQTEMQPVGGYGNLAGDMYLIFEAQKADGHRTEGIKCQFSIDWGEPNEST